MLYRSSSVSRCGSLSLMGLPFRLCVWCRSRHFTDVGRPAHFLARRTRRFARVLTTSAWAFSLT